MADDTGMTDKVDVADTYAKGGAAAVVNLAAAKAGRRPVVEMGLDRHALDIVREAWTHALVLEGRDGVYERAGLLVRIGGDPPHLEVVSPDAMLAVLVWAADWSRETRGKKGSQWSAVPPPEFVARVMRSRPHPEVRSIDAVLRVPVVDQEGEVVQQPGYHAGARCWYEPTGPCELVPESPTREQALEALEDLAEPLSDYAWETQADRAAALAMLLSPAVRRLSGSAVPLFVVDAPEKGSGKSKLGAVVAHLAGVGRAAVLTYKSDRSGEETQKQITALLLDGAPVIVLDNVKGKVDSGELESVLTADTWSGRILGESRMAHLPQQSIWILTSNNASLSEDLARRSVRVRINTRCEQPWLRRPEAFRHPDLVEWVGENHLRLARAAALVARAWVVAGRPQSTAPVLGSFERWSLVCGGILQWLGVEGFLSNLDDVYGAWIDGAADERAFVEAWGAESTRASSEMAGKSRRWSCKDLVGLCQRLDLLDRVQSGETDRARANLMAGVLKRLDGRVVGSYQVRCQQTSRGRREYWVEPLEREEPTSSTSTESESPR